MPATARAETVEPSELIVNPYVSCLLYLNRDDDKFLAIHRKNWRLSHFLFRFFKEQLDARVEIRVPKKGIGTESTLLDVSKENVVEFSQKIDSLKRFARNPASAEVSPELARTSTTTSS